MRNVSIALALALPLIGACQEEVAPTVGAEGKADFLDQCPVVERPADTYCGDYGTPVPFAADGCIVEYECADNSHFSTVSHECELAFGEGPLESFTVSYREGYDGFLYGTFASFEGASIDGHSYFVADDLLFQNYEMAMRYELYVPDGPNTYRVTMQRDGDGTAAMVTLYSDSWADMSSYYRCGAIPFQDE